jgi:hypothetical protein
MLLTVIAGSTASVRRVKSGRVAAVTLLIFVAASIWLAVVLPVASAFRELDNEIHNRRVLLGRFRAAAIRLADVAAERRALEQELGKGELLRHGPSAVLAAELQSQVTALVELRNVQVQSIQAMAPDTTGVFERVGLIISMQGNEKDVKEAVTAIEAQRPFLFVEQLAMTSLSGVDPSRAAMITAEMTISAFVRSAEEVDRRNAH